MSRLVGLSGACLIGIALTLTLSVPMSWAGPDYEFPDGEIVPEDVFVPVGMLGPPTEETIQQLFDAGYLTPEGFDRAMASLHALERGHFIWNIGITSSQMGPPSREELDAAYQAGYMTEEEYHYALEGIAAWEAAANDPEAQKALMEKYGDEAPHGMGRGSGQGFGASFDGTSKR